MSLSRKKLQEHCTSVNVTKKKLRSADSVQVELGKGNSEKMCLLFSPRLKVPSVCDAVTLDGKLFQTRGAATKKARSPIVERRDEIHATDASDAYTAPRHCSEETHPSLINRATYLYNVPCHDTADPLKHAPHHIIYHVILRYRLWA